MNGTDKYKARESPTFMLRLKAYAVLDGKHESTAHIPESGNNIQLFHHSKNWYDQMSLSIGEYSAVCKLNDWQCARDLIRSRKNRRINWISKGNRKWTVNFHHSGLLALQASTKKGPHSYRILGSQHTVTFVCLKGLGKPFHPHSCSCLPWNNDTKNSSNF